MVKHIVILEEGGCDPIVELPWGRQLDRDGLTRGAPEAWDQLCLALVTRSRTEPAPPLEVFVCLDDPELTETPDRRTLQGLLQSIRDHSWGARVYLVANREILPEALVQDGRESRQRYLETALEEKVDDFLQVSYDPDHSWQPRGQSLRAAADRSRERWETLRRLLPGAWSSILSPQEDLIFPLLLPWVQEARDPSNRLIVVNATPQAKQVATVKEALGEYGLPGPGHARVVVSLRKASRQLIEYCQANHLVGPLELKGALELWYLLLRLSRTANPVRTLETHLPHAEADPAWPSNGYIVKVKADGSPVFTLPAAGQEAMILVTSAFDPDEREQCLEAARDVGWLIARCPLGTALRVEPALTLGKLFLILDHFPGLNVWIHLGHGDWDGDLEINRAWTAPGIWLECFRERNVQLAVALFLACHSTLVARRFVEAGAGVGIGFDDVLGSRLSRELAVHVLEEVLAHGLHPTAALQGFRRGLHRLVVQEEEPSRPRAFSRST